MHEVLVNRLGGLSLPRKSVVRLTDRPDMTLAVYRGRKTTMQCNNIIYIGFILKLHQCGITIKCLGHRNIMLFKDALAEMWILYKINQKEGPMISCKQGMYRKTNMPDLI